jgi:predicted nucleic acid-binding protein
MIVLDTTVLSALMRRTEAPPTIAWFDRQDISQLWITAISVHEIRYGIELRPSSRRRRHLERNFQDLLAAGFEARMLPFDASAAESSARIAARRYRAGTPVRLGDTQIAGIAVSRNAALATHNRRQFSDLPVPVVDLGAAPA